MGARELQRGTMIDGFVVGDCLHEGAMGRLFSVRRDGDDFPMLMKVPRFGGGDSAQMLLAFETEATILPRLAGPHVPRFVAAGDVSTVPYIVTERIGGASLDRLAKGAQPEAEVARIGAAIADALHAVHAQEVIHLDLKPDNVVMRADGNAVLVDFALAHHSRLPDLLSQEMRYAAGSAPYISPEQVLGSRTDRRSDLFALGVILYELATGELPFGIPRTMAGLRDRLWVDPLPPRTRVPSISPWLQEVVLRLLEPDAARRYQSAAHVAFDLRHPEQVALTARAEKSARRGLVSQASNWWRARERGAQPGGAKEEPGAAPVIMVAVDTVHPDDARQPEIQRVTRRVLSLSAEFRLVCVAVVASPGPGEPGGGRNDPQVEHRIRLRQWIRPLYVDPGRVSLHVLESPDPAAALVDFARSNNVDLIVLGAPSPGERALAWWRSVASSVTANAPCSVHVVRVPEAPDALDAGQSPRTEGR
jgi:nucleotide-binding universal stress UspA family protein